MIVTVENLGPLHRATVDTDRRMLVFSGPNNSGKTYLSWVLYELLGLGERYWHRRNPSPNAREAALLLLADDSLGLEPGDLVALRVDAAARSVRELAGRLDNYFASPMGFFRGARVLCDFQPSELSRVAGAAHFQVFVDPKQPAAVSMYALPSIGNRATASIAFGDWPALPPSRNEVAKSAPIHPREPLSALDVAQQQSIVMMLANWLESPSALFPSRSAAPFPTERTAIHLFAREIALSRTKLVDEVLDSDAPEKDIRAQVRRAAGRYPVPVRDCLLAANDAVLRSREIGPLAHLATELEAITGGAVHVTSAGDLEFAPRTAAALRVPFQLTSSMVKSLASLVFHLRHQAQPGSTIVIDEPELNLHAPLQRRVTRLLAKVANSGVRVVMSTHSDYVLRELSSMVRLGEAGDRGHAVAEEMGYDTASLLKANDIGVWFFAGKATPVTVDAQGFSVAAIEQAVADHDRDLQRIEFELDG